jgi:hypothetical protein
MRIGSWWMIQKKICTFLGARVSQLSSVSGGGDGEAGARMVL